MHSFYLNFEIFYCVFNAIKHTFAYVKTAQISVRRFWSDDDNANATSGVPSITMSISIRLRVNGNNSC